MEPVEFRRRLHAHPELSFKEHDTTGVVARIKGRKTPEGDRRAAVLRADIDALPVTERNDCEWRSQNEGVMHACGHDMHAAVLFGVLKAFAEAPDFRGTLFGLFQPGEECNPGGASLVLAEKPFEGYDVRAVVGEHVEPQLEVGTLGFRAGKYMAASDELRFRVRGTGGHGAMRKQLKDPVAAGAELLTRLIALNGEECVLSIATARPGVLVSAPAISPTRLGVSIPTTYLSIKPVRLADPTIRSVSMINVFPFERKESKNPGPACMPMVKMNNTKPKFPSSLGMITPKCPNRRAIKITFDLYSAQYES